MYQDAVSLLQPTVVVLRICGVCPSALKTLHIPKSNKIHAFVLTIVYVIFILHLTSVQRSFTGLASLLSVLAILSDILNHFVLTTCAFLSSESLIKFFRIMESAQRSLFSLNIRQPPSPSKKSQTVWIAVMFTPKLMAVICQLIVSVSVVRISSLANTMVVTGTSCKIRVLLDLVNGKLELLNWHLDDLNNRWPVFLPRPPDVSFRELSCVREWRRTKFIQEDQDTRTVTPEKIRNFNKAHLKLVYAMKTLNSIFSLTVLIFIVSTILKLAISIPLIIDLKLPTLIRLELILSAFGDISALYSILSLSSKIQDQVTLQFYT